MSNKHPKPRRRRAATLKHDEFQGPARLVVIEGERIGQKFTLDQTKHVIGRGVDVQIELTDPEMSRRHAEIRRIGPFSYVIEDLQSSNGTYINGAPLKTPTALYLGDKIRLGSNVVLLFTVHDPIEDQILQRQRLEALGRLGAGIAHDFNNMLGAVLSNIEYLQSQPLPSLATATTTECLADMHNAATRAAELSKRLLAFARGEKQADAHIEVSTVCEEVAQLVRRTFDRSIRVETNIASDLRAFGDSMELHQVLMNLCLNARDAMLKGGLLSISARSLPSDTGGKQRIQIVVSDDGTGMDAKTQARAFEPFFTTKRDGAGFGLGLATVREIITALQGRISVESSKGRGTSFTITLPLADTKGAPAQRQPPAAKPLSAAPDNANLIILVVDDETMVRRAARRLLRQVGHTVHEAESCDEALSIYAQADTRPDLVILDVEMPDTNGEETLVMLLDLDPDARVLMVSGHRDKDRAAVLRGKGARGFLHKPWTTDELLDNVNRIAGADGLPRTGEPPRSANDMDETIPS